MNKIMKTIVLDKKLQKEVKEFDYLLPCATQIIINGNVYYPCSSFYDSDTEYLIIYVITIKNE
jgi:hypothetical protein